MTAPTQLPPARRGLRGYVPFLLLGLGVILLVIVTDRPAQGPPLDPRSTSSLGTKGLVDVLGELGARTEIIDDIPGDQVTAALILDDSYQDADRERVLDWVGEGGVLVVTDQASPLHPEFVGPTDVSFTNPSLARRCSLRGLEAVNRVSAPGGSVHEVPEGSVGCFPRNGGAWLIARDEGEGTVVTVGGSLTFTNGALGEWDNAVLAVALLAPDPARARVAILGPPPPGQGDATLTDLIATPVKLAFVQLLIAFGVVVAWRARRLGRPVVEPQPVELPGSELVVAVGNLLQSTDARGHAAGVLRAEARRFLAERLGLPSRAEPEQVADAAAARTGASRAAVLDLLTGSVAAPDRMDDAGLVRLAQSVEDVRRATLAAPPPAELTPSANPGASRVQ